MTVNVIADFVSPFFGKMVQRKKRICGLGKMEKSLALRDIAIPHEVHLSAVVSTAKLGLKFRRYKSNTLRLYSHHTVRFSLFQAPKNVILAEGVTIDSSIHWKQKGFIHLGIFTTLHMDKLPVPRGVSHEVSSAASYHRGRLHLNVYLIQQALQRREYIAICPAWCQGIDSDRGRELSSFKPRNKSSPETEDTVLSRS
uniref:Uncharacterized protein n=1 Tax=Fusarium oxysporum (strain Fo5176) TaxID=660025 RepID=A0A0D2YCU6_FUSOF